MDCQRIVGSLCLLLLAPGCVELEGSRPEGSLDRANSGIDVADYLLLDCEGPSRANRVGSQVKFTIPMGSDGERARFVIMKSTDGTGFEEWAVDDDWFYIRRDTTWAYENPAQPGDWCDTQCGENGPSNCAKRWAGDSGDWVYTIYHEPGDYGRPARWLPRTLDLGVGQSTTFTTTMAIQAERTSGCDPCWTNFSSPSVDRTVEATLLPSWEGFDDVLRLRVLAGPGAGERYYYGRGRGWIGFNSWVAEPAPVEGTAVPALTCGGYLPAEICSWVDGDGEVEPAPPAPAPEEPPAPAPEDPPPPTADGQCPCLHGTTAGGEPISNFCHYPPGTDPDCGMLAPGGYCDPNGDGSFGDADWLTGWAEYQDRCG
ncbi:MAG: hypothetical protein H6712_03980 [Myxococcales bacterium]|nr:hypothetical protein [Myxococcales bacterium]